MNNKSTLFVIISYFFNNLKISIRNHAVRNAVYTAYKGECFYTGRSISFEKMHIDHLIPLNRGGSDSLDNYVLTFRDLNLGKRDKIDERLVQAKAIVEMVFLPRMEKFIRDHYRKKKHKRKKERIKSSLKKASSINRSYSKQRLPKLTLVYHRDLFWANDNKMEVLSSSKKVTSANIEKILPFLENEAESAFQAGADYTFDIWLTSEYIQQISSLWVRAKEKCFKLIDNILPYDDVELGCYGSIYFSSEYLELLNWQEEKFQEL